MSPEITSQVFVQVRFTVTDGEHEYTDALYFTPEEHAALSPRDLAERQAARFDNWKAIVTAPPIELKPEEQAAQKAAQITMLTEQLASVQEQILSLATPDEALAILQTPSEAVIEKIAAAQVTLDAAVALDAGTIAVKG